MDALRRLVLQGGIPKERTTKKKKGVRAAGGRKTPSTTVRLCSLRGRVWKVLLGVTTVNAVEYIALVSRGPSPEFEAIQKDIVRTFASDEDFGKRVPPERLIRALTAFDHWGRSQPMDPFTYAQGMDVLLAPLLYVLPELDAFFTFRQLVTSHLRSHFTGGLTAIHRRCEQVHRCLAAVDKPLADHLLAQQPLYFQVFAFPRLYSLMACRPPLAQLLQLWDTVFAFGAHFVVLLCVAEAHIHRNAMLEMERGSLSVLDYRTMAPMDASTLTTAALTLVKALPDDLYQELLADAGGPPEEASGTGGRHHHT